MGDRLGALWDFDDLDGSEQRLRAQLDAETSDVGRAEVLAELARIHGLRGDFADGDALLDEATGLAGDSLAARARIDLERGRLRRSGGDPNAARPLFESAFASSLEVEHYFMAADAAHMVALVAGDREDFVAWTERGIALAERREEASHWVGPLLNNLGWEYFEGGDYGAALDAFERALTARQKTPQNAEPIALASYAVGKALRALDRAGEAIPLLEQAVAWADDAGRPDGWYHEELAEEYAAVGRSHDARAQAQLAIPLLEAADPSFTGDADRSAPLRALAED
jgi:tetratricopeptide (TPR) repeat protein